MKIDLKEYVYKNKKYMCECLLLYYISKIPFLIFNLCIANNVGNFCKYFAKKVFTF